MKKVFFLVILFLFSFYAHSEWDAEYIREDIYKIFEKIKDEKRGRSIDIQHLDTKVRYDDHLVQFNKAIIFDRNHHIDEILNSSTPPYSFFTKEDNVVIFLDGTRGSVKMEKTIKIAVNHLVIITIDSILNDKGKDKGEEESAYPLFISEHEENPPPTIEIRGVWQKGHFVLDCSQSKSCVMIDVFFGPKDTFFGYDFFQDWKGSGILNVPENFYFFYTGIRMTDLWMTTYYMGCVHGNIIARKQGNLDLKGADFINSPKSIMWKR